MIIGRKLLELLSEVGQMKNKEKYAKEIMNIACSGDSIAVMKKSGRIVSCNGIKCSLCLFCDGNRQGNHCIIIISENPFHHIFQPGNQPTYSLAITYHPVFSMLFVNMLDNQFLLQEQKYKHLFCHIQAFS